MDEVKIEGLEVEINKNNDIDYIYDIIGEYHADKISYLNCLDFEEGDSIKFTRTEGEDARLLIIEI